MWSLPWGLMARNLSHTHAAFPVNLIVLYLINLMIFGKVKLSRYHHAGDKGERNFSSYSILSSTLDGGEWMVFGKECKLWGAWLFNTFQPPAPSYHYVQEFSSPLPSQTPWSTSSIRLTDQVSCPYKRIGKIIALYYVNPYDYKEIQDHNIFSTEWRQAFPQIQFALNLILNLSCAKVSEIYCIFK
jgi:hypothetical protein